MKILPEQLLLYAVTDKSWLRPGERLAEVTEELLQAGVTCVQLRDKQAEDALFLEEAKELKVLCDRYRVPFIVNDRVEIAKAVGASGVHVGLSDMGIKKAREILGDSFVIGGSAHNVQEALAAQEAGADYIGCGAVFGSSTKKDVTLLSAEELRAICGAVRIPAVAIGGITRENVRRLSGTGIAGTAVVSALFAAGDKRAAAREMLALVKEL